MKPNYEKAATLALKVLKENKITAAPVIPLPIIKNMEGVVAMPFADLAAEMGMDRGELVPMFGENQDAVTFHLGGRRARYVVAYNQYLPLDMIRRAAARELGHIVLGHDGTRPVDVRMEEAMCFARHLLFPRPLIHAIQESGLPLTVEVVGSITGCYERCLAGLRKTPGVYVDPALNREIKEQFSGFIQNFTDLQVLLSKGDKSRLADFGSFMVNYEE